MRHCFSQPWLWHGFSLKNRKNCYKPSSSVISRAIGEGAWIEHGTKDPWGIIVGDALIYIAQTS